MTAMQHARLVQREQRIDQFYRSIDTTLRLSTRLATAAMAWAFVVYPATALDMAFDLVTMGFVA